MCKKGLFITVIVLATVSVSPAYTPIYGFNVGQQNGAYRPAYVPYDSSLRYNACATYGAAGGPGCPGIVVAQASGVGVSQSAAAYGFCGPSGASQGAAAQGGQMQIITPIGGLQSQGAEGGMGQTAWRTGGYTTGAAMQGGGAAQSQNAYAPTYAGQQYQNMGSMQSSMVIGSPDSSGIASATTSGQMDQFQVFL